jgi:hypothetical protein
MHTRSLCVFVNFRQDPKSSQVKNMGDVGLMLGLDLEMDDVPIETPKRQKTVHLAANEATTLPDAPGSPEHALTNEDVYEADMEALPDGWMALTHRNSLPFWYHEQSGVVVWTKPYVCAHQPTSHNPPFSAFSAVVRDGPSTESASGNLLFSCFSFCISCADEKSFNDMKSIAVNLVTSLIQQEAKRKKRSFEELAAFEQSKRALSLRVLCSHSVQRSADAKHLKSSIQRANRQYRFCKSTAPTSSTPFPNTRSLFKVRSSTATPLHVRHCCSHAFR